MPGGWKHYDVCCSVELYSILLDSQGLLKENKHFKALQEDCCGHKKKKLNNY